MSEGVSLRVSGNSPRLLKDGESPPSQEEQQPTAEELEVPHVYWTSDKAAHVVARIGHAASKFYGPTVKMADWELELIGEPAAAVMNDWLPLRVGANSNKYANLIAFGVVAAIIIALRLPDILEVHGVIKPWKPKGAQQPAESQEPQQPAAAQVAPQAGVDAGTFDEQLVGANGGGSGDDDKRRSQIFGAQTVGGSDFARSAQ